MEDKKGKLIIHYLNFWSCLRQKEKKKNWKVFLSSEL